ncbi:zinc-ribbon domain-containing protein [Metabacillus endolithicus]|uniref:Zinc-ribbon domain-containing protein n=1 Tax=Metabacillus endolithicus TaxID=1535204 RepID=A0ABW5C6E3_9BACI|nr:zinc-ribbon domain-containing protein [Metabacillus endolithicus]UPG66159.1 zinc-ribbon domain-containing protein [Metabacillus endolithicus]
MGRRKTHEEFVQEVFELVGEEYEILGTYINAKTKIKMIHSKCGYEWETATPSNFTNKNNPKRCPKCAGNIQKTTELFKKEVFNLVGDEYTVLGEYINAHHLFDQLNHYTFFLVLHWYKTFYQSPYM